MYMNEVIAVSKGRSDCIAFVGFAIEPHDFVLREVGILRIEFRRGGIYDYEDVPYHIFQELLDAPSMGNYYHRNIKGCWDSIPVLDEFAVGPFSSETVDNIKEVLAPKKNSEAYAGDYLLVFGTETVIDSAEMIFRKINELAAENTSYQVYKIGECLINNF